VKLARNSSCELPRKKIVIWTANEAATALSHSIQEQNARFVVTKSAKRLA
jgi:hypothetical protein